MDSSPLSWQALLQEMIRRPEELEHLATAVGVTTTTLTRWANKLFTPQRPHLLRLVQVVPPQYRERLIAALEVSYPDFHLSMKAAPLETVPPSFFAQILNIRTTAAEPLRFMRITELVFQQALKQLDPNNLGMAIVLVVCMPPRPEDGKIRTLRERAGMGTYPWPHDLEQFSIFLGMESLAGYGIERRHEASVADLRDAAQPFPVHRTEFEISAGAAPIWFSGLIGGCLLASSTQPNHFTQQRLALLNVFSDLASFALNKDEFYPPNLVELRVMPNYTRQRDLLSTFRWRVYQEASDALVSGEPTMPTDTELHVWSQLEGMLINRPYDPDEYPEISPRVDKLPSE